MIEKKKSVETLVRKLWTGRRCVGVVAVVVAALAIPALGSCLGPESVQCGETLCQKGEECDIVHEECVLPEQRIICQGKLDGAPCTIGGDDRYVCDLEVCLPWRCGDGVVSGDEVCDDGNTDDHDSCRNSCKQAVCGDGVQHVGAEGCDGDDFGGIICANLGFSGGTLVCLANCVVDRSDCVGGCGNGILEVGEECDEGLDNSDIAPDGCRFDCRQAWCGDGVLDSGEVCDEGPANSDIAPDACRTDCRLAWCGDGVVDSGEECDEGPANSNIVPNACRSDCNLAECGDGVVDSGEECDDGNTASWDGCNSCGISELQVNTSTGGSQYSPAVGMADDGRFVVVWVSNGEIFAQRYDAQGITSGGDIQVNTLANGTQWRPAVAMASDGRFVVVWESDDVANYGIYAQRFDAQGNPLSGEIQANSTPNGELWFPAVAMADDGRFVVTWGNQDQSAYGIYTQRFDSQGTPVAGEVQVNTTTLGWQHVPAVTMAGDGRFVVVWQSTELNGSDYDIAAQRFDAQGNPFGGEFQVNTFTSGSQGWPALAMVDDGGFVVVWHSNGQDGSMNGIYAQRYDVQGSPSGGEIQVNTYMSDDQEFPAVATAADGSFVVVWHSYDQDGDREGIFTRHFSAQGNPLGGELQINTYTSGEQELPAIAMAGDGRFVVVWQSDDQDGSDYGIFAQRFDAQGNALGVGP